MAEDMYIPVTFICDTGAPGFIYINSLTYRLLGKRILSDSLENEFIKIGDSHFHVKPSPANHPDTNILGLRILSVFGLHINDETFGFESLPQHF